MTSPLDLEARQALLHEAATARASLEQKAAAEAATALAILIRDGSNVLERALEASTHVELGAATKYWLDFRRVLAPTVAAIARERGPVGVAFFLGCLKRLAVLSGSPESDRSAQATSSRVRGLAAAELKAGDIVEAVLLEERTKKGGWKARHVATGITGPIINSDAVPSDRAPDDTVKLLVAAVARREASFRWPNEPSART
jgi:hypothetical protein